MVEGSIEKYPIPIKAIADIITNKELANVNLKLLLGELKKNGSARKYTTKEVLIK
jgi:hypothetical protein